MAQFFRKKKKGTSAPIEVPTAEDSTPVEMGEPLPIPIDPSSVIMAGEPEAVTEPPVAVPDQIQEPVAPEVLPPQAAESDGTPVIIDGRHRLEVMDERPSNLLSLIDQVKRRSH